MGTPPLHSAPGTSWADFLADNASYCAFFGCDDEGYCVGASKSVLSATNGCGAITSSCRNPPEETERDYAAEHDSFLDSLLFEQQQHFAASRGAASFDDDLLSEPGNNHSTCTESTNNSWALSPASSHGSLSDSVNSRKRRRGLLATNPRKDLSLAHGEQPLFQRKPNIKPPATFLHPACRMQKDKGKGEEVGSSICAKGSEACLGKLRAKMLLLTENCQPGATSASMKRRGAVVSNKYENFIETRSLLTLRMGFLSMTYGILLRWDFRKTGLVSVVVLRKNCHETFYKKSAEAITSFCPPPVSLASSVEERSLKGLSPPYLVPRPTTFPPAKIMVSVLYATGLNKKSHWTVQLQLADQTENILLSFDGNMMLPKLGGPLQYTVAGRSLSSTVLEIRLLEHRLRRKTRVLRYNMTLPLHSLEAVSSDATEQATTMRVPCPDGATIQIESTFVSDASVWQRRELEARRRRRTPPKSRKSRAPVAVVKEEELSSPWDWLCIMC